MASDQTTGAAESVLKCGQVSYKGKDHELLALGGSLRLLTCHEDDSSAKTPVLDVPWRDVICACEAPAKKSKSLPDAKTASPSQTFIVYYIAKDSKTKKCHCGNAHLQTSEDSSEVWISLIEDKRKEGKAQKLLVIINPIGGKGTARQQFEKCARPLFSLAGIELVVKVTERPQHAMEIARSFDVSTVDGLVVVGGDGMYVEVIHPLILQAQEEAGVDVNDPDATLVAPPPVRIGILPAGTGNGFSNMINGVVDFETAVLNVIRGEVNRVGVFALHEPGKLIHYCGLMVAYGVYSVMIAESEDLRWMKRLRYFYLTVTKLFGKKRVYDIDVEILQNKPQEENMEGQSGDDTALPVTKWTRLGVRHVTSLLAMIADLDLEIEGDKMDVDPFADVFHTTLVTTQSGLDFLKMIYGFQKMKKEALQQDYIEVLGKLRGLRFRLVEGEKKAEQSASGTSSQKDYSKLLNVDGEAVTCSIPQLELRFHPHLVPVYSCRDKR